MGSSRNETPGQASEQMESGRRGFVAAQQSHRTLRVAFRTFNHFMLGMWHLGLGSWVNFWPAVGGRIMVLVHVGRSTGKPRRTPVNYAISEGHIYCTAAFGPAADWYKNVLGNPSVEVWLHDGWWAGVATDVSDSESRLALLREVLIGSGFASYLAGIAPKSISDAELARKTQEYRLLRIERRHALSGRGGPGELSWVWPIAAFVLLAVLMFR